MNEAMILHIRLAPGITTVRPDQAAVNELSGGPETLLRWLETQLGLPVPDIHHASRVTEYATALDTLTDSTVDASMKADRWATASELLSRRDELLLAGWDEVDSDSLPDVVRDLARAAKGRSFMFPGEAERLQNLLDALDAGQTLPANQCVLHDAKQNWPVMWQKILARVNVTDPPEHESQGPAGTALREAQTVIGGGDAAVIEQESTFRYLHTRSESVAAEFIAATLARDVDKLSTTVICCEDDDLALRLDACLSRAGLPTTGASARSRAHPVLQVLPLSLAMCWKPIDPQVLLDFLTLPVLPLPRTAASRLAEALTKEPGLGSSEWQEAVQELCSKENDPEGKLQERLSNWLFFDRVPQAQEIPSRLVRSRCTLVAQWASGRAELLARDEHPTPELIDALRMASGQASLLGELAECQAKSLSEPQLARLLEEAVGSGAKTTPHIEADGGPIRVRSLAEIDGPCNRLIWLGLGTTDSSGCRWSTNQLRELREAGINIDDGTKALSALRSAETRGYCNVRETFLAVLVPQDLEKRWHPIWLAIRSLLSEDDIERPPALEDLVLAGDTSFVAPFTFEIQDAEIEPCQKSRALWDIPAEALSDRETVSATELQDRLGCPLKWTLNYQAKIRASSLAELPGDFQLKGIFCHSILERVFGDGGDLPSVDEAAALVTAAFDERVSLDAAPLAQPDKYIECQQVRSELENATRVLVSALASGGYRIVGLEVPLEGEAFGKSLNGWVDCVVVDEDGDEAVIDFKYGGRSKYYSLIEDGKAVQLATYAYGRRQAGGKFPAVAYLVLADGLLYTPSGSPLKGNASGVCIDAPAIQAVWKQFSEAIDNADDWLTTDEPVPARPLQEPGQWPASATMVLEEKLKDGSLQAVCKYCDYQTLCGLQENA